MSNGKTPSHKGHSLSSISEEATGAITIPASLSGYPVAEIGDGV